MTALILIVCFIFGTIIGSFLNVVIYRINTNLKISKGRSRCFSCSRELEAVDLVPVLSYAFFRGRCRTCRSKISFQYPAVEITTGLMFILITYLYFFSGNIFVGTYMFDRNSVFTVTSQFPILKNIFYALDLGTLSLLICIFVYDFKHKIIPDTLVYSGAALMLIKTVVLVCAFRPDALGTVLALLAGPLVALPFAFFFFVSGGRWMGLGDAKLALIIGWGLGLSYGFTALMYSFWIGAIVIIGLMLVRELFDAFSTPNNALGLRIKFLHNKKLEYFAKKLPSYKLRSEIPFGPFMIIAFYFVYCVGRNLLWWMV